METCKCVFAQSSHQRLEGLTGLIDMLLRYPGRGINQLLLVPTGSSAVPALVPKAMCACWDSYSCGNLRAVMLPGRRPRSWWADRPPAGGILGMSPQGQNVGKHSGEAAWLGIWVRRPRGESECAAGMMNIFPPRPKDKRASSFCEARRHNTGIFKNVLVSLLQPVVNFLLRGNLQRTGLPSKGPWCASADKEIKCGAICQGDKAATPISARTLPQVSSTCPIGAQISREGPSSHPSLESDEWVTCKHVLLVLFLCLFTS